MYGATTPAGPAVQGLFNRADHERLRESLRQLHDLLPLLDSARKCGIDVDYQERVRAEMTEALTQIEQLFMTPPPQS